MRPLVVEAGWVAAPGGALRAGAAILIEDGRVTAVEPAAALAGVDAERIGGPGTLALPGFVNAHQHGRPDPTVALGAPDAPLECWLVSLLATPAYDAYADTLRLCRRLLAAGTTTAVHSHYTRARTAEEYDAELRALLRGYRDGGVRGVVAADLRDRGQPVFGDEPGFMAKLPEELRGRVAALVGPPLPLEPLLEVVAGIRAEVRAGALGDVDLIYGPPGPPWCSDALLARVAAAAAGEDARVHTHLLETRCERAFGLRAYPEGTVGGLARLGLLNDRLFVAHGVWLDDADVDAVAAAGASVVTNPGSNLRLHAGVAPVRRLLAAGVNVALGTDNMALGDRDEILDELRLARALQRSPGVEEAGLDARALLALLTVGGARALGRPDLGVLRPGARGDVVLVDLDRLRRPGADVDPLELALATARPDDLAAVVSGGRVVATGDGGARPPGPPLGAPPRDVAAALLPHARAHYRALEAAAR